MITIHEVANFDYIPERKKGFVCDKRSLVDVRSKWTLSRDSGGDSFTKRSQAAVAQAPAEHIV
ncbi:MAG: hypothetical protein ABI999_12670, partial [Acidobacteriota bacterium]